MNRRKLAAYVATMSMTTAFFGAWPQLAAARTQNSMDGNMSDFDHSKGEYFILGDARIYTETAGNPQGDALVLLHGGLGNMTDFNGILGALAPQFRFIGIDFRGHGKSTLGGMALSYSLYASDVEQILDHLGVQTYSIMGFSDGGIVGYRLAAKPGSGVQRLLTLGSQWRLAENDPSIDDLGGLTGQMWREFYPESVAYYEAVNPEPDLELLIERVKRVWLDMTDKGYPGARVDQIKAPLLVARGDQDHLLSLEEAVALRRRVEGASFLNIPFAEHEAHKESPAIFTLAANQFLQSNGHEPL